MPRYQLTERQIYELRSLPRPDLLDFIATVEQQDQEYADYLRSVTIATVGRTELADFFAIAIDTVDSWKRKGCPYEGKMGVESRYDLQKVAQWLAHQKNIVIGDSEREETDRLLREEKRKMAEIQRKKAEGSLVELERVQYVILTVITTIQGRLTTLQKQVGTDVVDTFNDTIDDAKEAFVREFEQM